jgi:leader peptidase (prepilin peptidase)/N-methyltransferase
MGIVIFILGAVLGSFLNVCIYRLPRKQSIIREFSHCIHCKKNIRWYDNIPILSFLILKGRCRFCKNKIPIRYLMVELLTPLLLLLLFYRYQSAERLTFISYLIFLSYLIIITFTDIECQIIPDKATYPVLVVGVILALVEERLILFKILGGLVLSGIFFLLAYLSLLILKKEGLGGGDIKLAGVIGLYLGLHKGIIAMLIGSIIGSIVGITLILLKKINRSTYLPYGSFLAIGSLIMLFLDRISYPS